MQPAKLCSVSPDMSLLQKGTARKKGSSNFTGQERGQTDLTPELQCPKSGTCMKTKMLPNRGKILNQTYNNEPTEHYKPY